VLPTPGTTQAIVADVLAGGGVEDGAAATPPTAREGAADRALDVDGAADDELLAERRGRVRMVYVVLALLGASVAAFYLWRLLSAR
jgi:hypothetical protein